MVENENTIHLNELLKILVVGFLFLVFLAWSTNSWIEDQTPVQRKTSAGTVKTNVLGIAPMLLINQMLIKKN